MTQIFQAFCGNLSLFFNYSPHTPGKNGKFTEIEGGFFYMATKLGGGGGGGLVYTRKYSENFDAIHVLQFAYFFQKSGCPTDQLCG